VVGLDSEWKPSFLKGEKAAVALLQLSSRTACYLVDMLAVAAMPPALVDAALGPVLAGASWVGVGVRVRDRVQGAAAAHRPPR